MVFGISNFANKCYSKQADALAAFNKLRRQGQVAIATAREPRPYVILTLSSAVCSHRLRQLILAAHWGHVVALILAGLAGFAVALYRNARCDQA